MWTSGVVVYKRSIVDWLWMQRQEINNATVEVVNFRHSTSDALNHTKAVTENLSVTGGPVPSVINPHPFEYLINPTNTCANKDVFLLIFIHSTFSRFNLRSMIRQTWGNPKNLPGVIVKRVFLFGATSDRRTQDELLRESNTHGDIIQEDFEDSYRNLTYKAIMGLKWIAAYCTQAKFLLKTDDDVFVNIFKLMTHLITREPNNLLMCCILPTYVFRVQPNKWYVTREEYPNDTYPPYCLGRAVVLTTDVAAAMFRASFHVRYFWIDDVYVTGILARVVGVKHVRFNHVYATENGKFFEQFAGNEYSPHFIFGHTDSGNTAELKIVWERTLAEQRGIGIRNLLGTKN